MKLNLVVIRSNDMDRLCEFYTRLGLEFIKHRHGKGPVHYSCEIDSCVFEIYPLQKGLKEPDTSTRLGFEIETLDAIVSKLSTENVPIISFPKHTEFGFAAVVKDPDGRKVELKERESLSA